MYAIVYTHVCGKHGQPRWAYWYATFCDTISVQFGPISTRNMSETTSEWRRLSWKVYNIVSCVIKNGPTKGNIELTGKTISLWETRLPALTISISVSFHNPWWRERHIMDQGRNMLHIFPMHLQFRHLTFRLYAELATPMYYTHCRCITMYLMFILFNKQFFLLTVLNVVLIR